jgi:tetratricopeptide (TPR) repeat protein
MTINRSGTDFDPVAALEALLAIGAPDRDAAAQTLASDPGRFAAVAESVRALSSQSTDRGIEAARVLVDAVAQRTDVRPADGREAAAHRALVRALAWAGRFDESIEVGLRAEAIADAGGPVEETVRTRLAMMHPLTELGRLAEAIECGRRAQSLATEGGRFDLAARADINLGIALRRRDEPREAVACFRRARPHLAAEPAILASLENSLGEALVELQEFAGAEEAFARARAGFESAGASLQAAIAESNLADLAYRQGRLHRALALFETARRRLAGEDTAVHRARILAEEADARAVLGLHDSAVSGYAAALPLLDRFGLVLEAARARKGMGAALRSLDRPSEAATALAAASQAFTDLDHRTARARCDLIRAGLELDAGRPDAARRLTSAAIAVVGDRPADLAGARLLLGEIAVREGQDDLAAAEFAAGLALARELDLAPLLADLLHAVGRHQRRGGRLVAARATLDEAVDQIERVRGALQARRFRAAFLGDRASVHEERLATILDAWREEPTPAGLADAFEAAELARHRGLLDEMLTVEARVAGAAGEPEAEPEDEREAEPEAEPGPTGAAAADRSAREVARIERQLADDQRALNVLYSRIGDAALAGEAADAGVRRSIRERERSAADLTMRLEAAGGGSPMLARPVALEEVRASLPADTRMIAFAIVEGMLARFVVDAGGVDLHPAVIPVPELDALVRRLRFQIERGLRPGAGDGPRATRLADDARRAAIALHAAAFTDLPPAPDAVRRLLVVPDGSLRRVPPGILHDGERWLASRYAITVAPSVSVHHRLAQRTPSPLTGRLVVGVADPAAPEIEGEAAMVAETLAADGHPVMRRLGPAATASSVMTAMADARAIHLAAHGRFDAGQPHASGLRLHDRWLTVGDLARARLDADLVTLAGCETGLGGDDGGEVVGLVRALLSAGARRVVASHWAVDDAVTREVMVRLHATSGNAAGGVSAFDVAAALTRVHDELAGEHPHPAHWGGFVLMGRN